MKDIYFHVLILNWVHIILCRSVQINLRRERIKSHACEASHLNRSTKMSKQHFGGMMFSSDAPDQPTPLRGRISGLMNNMPGIFSLFTNLIGIICWILSLSFFVRSLTLDIWYEFENLDHLLGNDLDVPITDIHIKQLTALQPIPILMITLILHLLLPIGLLITFEEHVNIRFRAAVLLTMIAHGVSICYFIMIPFQKSNHATCVGCTSSELAQYSLSNATQGPSFWWLVASWSTFIVFAIPLYGTTMALLFNNWRKSSFDMQFLEAEKKEKMI